MASRTAEQRLRDALESLMGAREVMRGAWIAVCPAASHDALSLTWSYRADGAVSLACQSGCPADAVLTALRISVGPDDDAGEAQAMPTDGTATVQPPAIALAADVLQAAADAVASLGVAGECPTVKLLYLAVTSRLLDRPVSVAVKGPSAAGKSYLVDNVLHLFPDSAFYALSAMSEKALIYDKTPLIHRMLVLYEAAGMTGDFLTYIIRSLLSEGRVRYATVEPTKNGWRPRLIERDGPTGLLTTTTAVRLHPENETRMLSVTISDQPEQTRAVLMAYAAGAPEAADLTPWQEFQVWLSHEPAAVSVPYLATLAELIPPVAVRLRRDFPTVVALIKAHALLHQISRPRDADGAVVATVADYAAVRELVADLLAEAVERAVPDSMRQTVEQVRALVRDSGETTVLAVSQALGIDKSAGSRRVRAAIDRGYVRNLEEHRGRPSRLVIGDPLPEQQELLPDPERLHGCSAPGRDADADSEPEYVRYASPMSWAEAPADLMSDGPWVEA